jgi:ubiquinone/menaquinone biosynthesis C-methylase UbiE
MTSSDRTPDVAAGAAPGPDVAAGAAPGPDVAAGAAPEPNPHATAEEVEAARRDSKLAQVLYHDWEAESYDDKWSISYDQRCIDYARGRFDAIVPDEVQRDVPYDRALELGCGTGFFLLNLIQSGVARRGSVTDLSPGMVKVATRNGLSLGLDVDGRVADAEGIPYEDNTFDLVVGHAVLHHIPDVELSLREVVRVLKPGGRFVFAGEPTTTGNVYARNLSTLTWRVATNVTKLPGLSGWRKPQSELDESSRAAALEAVVDLHTFEPGDLERMARNAGAVEVATASEEFTAAMLGWPIRTFEALVPAGRLGWGWAKFAFNRWIGLSWVDANVWRHVVPKGWFYNVMITGVKPS